MGIIKLLLDENKFKYIKNWIKFFIKKYFFITVKQYCFKMITKIRIDKKK